MSVDALLGGFAQVVPEVPPVRDLYGLWGAAGRALGEEGGSVAADDLDAGPLGEPGRQRGRRSVGEAHPVSDTGPHCPPPGPHIPGRCLHIVSARPRQCTSSALSRGNIDHKRPLSNYLTYTRHHFLCSVTAQISFAACRRFTKPSRCLTQSMRPPRTTTSSRSPVACRSDYAAQATNTSRAGSTYEPTPFRGGVSE